MPCSAYPWGKEVEMPDDEPATPPASEALPTAGAENDAKRAHKRGVAAERNRIIALLTERAEATREWDGQETAVSLTYRKAIEAIQTKEG